MNRKEWINYVEKEDTGYPKRAIVCDLFDVIDSIEEQNKELQSLLDLKQQEISVLESKMVELSSRGIDGPSRV